MNFFKIESKVKIFPFRNKLYKDDTIHWLLKEPREYDLDTFDSNLPYSEMKKNINLFLVEDDKAKSLAYWLKEKRFPTEVIEFSIEHIPTNIENELMNNYERVITGADGNFLSNMNPSINGYINTNNIIDMEEILSIKPILAEIEILISDLRPIDRQLILNSLKYTFNAYHEYEHKYSDTYNFFERYYKTAFLIPSPME